MVHRSERDRFLAGLAEKQYGAFCRRQALALGHNPDSIEYMLKRGRWLYLLPAVYGTSGSHDSWHRRQSAACLWSEGLAAGLAAAFLHGLPGFEEPSPEIVTIRNKRVMPHSGIVVR